MSKKLRVRTIIYDDGKDTIMPDGDQYNDTMVAILNSQAITNVAHSYGIEIFLSVDIKDQVNTGYHHVLDGKETPKKAISEVITSLEHAFHRGHDRLWVHQNNKETKS